MSPSRCATCLERALREDARQLGTQLSGIDVAIAFSDRALRDLAGRGLRAVTLSIHTPLAGPIRVDVAIDGITSERCECCPERDASVWGRPEDRAR